MTSLIHSSKTQAWLDSLRPKTLPLAFASIVTGSAIASWHSSFKPGIALLALLTAGLLQILSNLANDYGDAIKGSDTEARIGPLRGIQTGMISLTELRNALILTILLTIVSGIALVTLACEKPIDIVVFLSLGCLAILAAITYTVGNRPYGYIGLGDISVLIFFGWLSVAGSYYLQTGHFNSIVILPATACGLLATAVLNINNLRDIDNDRMNGKNTLAVRLGAKKARCYHMLLLMTAPACLALFALFYLHSLAGWLFILTLPLLIHQACYVLRETTAFSMRPMLEKTVKGALLTNLLFAVGVMLS
ncbi:1,4-dihydroxy-2-naphthoate polyprenyltransferase [Pectobacteriaceae bacterium CE70]|uniref:1,4-dihydroxy-2-naphthoate octaprenyltransferase n=1 Tax=Serratia sp. (strain ATCC 39006) TaxID=104623 RepID=A0A2I5T326_SERS3|nr:MULTISPECIES: 1,4-dihydroxy-2-naphthoate polyprenyltransferase [Enterobacterales]WJV58108.1 1,4-dihydroxy-2-naphthoate polyprenyltransferase [Pectobacteriaceae bacterium C111]WJV62403.1 1,4-dihydroxy-2-naphthoate polyprenyltransferase [Pectobacteriaceae bacterium C52]WJV66712.1 1,4-dihydroxy-2-naphthoate polyprenyltransferase [Pectobacteriaceae bacterium CE70]WJY10708.1 1,4-dihydroxy-2-naphthoate polyprenyltransferase [Pectobacteriaceae bacterium C80]AUG98977.1 1,4-dihydroxy-2-naphthoate po